MRIFFSLLLFCFSVSSFASSRISLSVDGRVSEVVVPAGGGQGKPVILLLHGYMGNAALMDYWFGLSRAVDQRGFVLVLPNGLEDSQSRSFWNASSACCDFDHRGIDDISYLSKLVSQVSSRFATDRSRLFVVGHSNGGFMAHRLACSSSLRIRAIVSFAGVLGPEACKPSEFTSVLQIHALDDDTIKYLGDAKGYDRLTGYQSAPATIASWVAADHCIGAPVSLPRRDLTLSIPGDDTTRVAYRNCAGGSRVELWTLDAFQAWYHFPHTPLLNDTFTSSILDFLFGS